MEKIGVFDFIAILLPGCFLTCMIILLVPFHLNISDPELNQWLQIILILLFGYSVGFVVSFLGLKIEIYIDAKIEHFTKRRNKEIQNDLTKVFLTGFSHQNDLRYKEVAEEFFNYSLEDESGNISLQRINFLFDLIRETLIQEKISSKADILNMQAIFLRNLTATCILLFFLSILFLVLFYINYNPYVIENYREILLWGSSITFALLAIIFRYLSQNRYQWWFRQVLISFYIFSIRDKVNGKSKD